jgi:hypothetical protein
MWFLMYPGTLHKQKVELNCSLMVCSGPQGWPIQKVRHMTSSPHLHATLSKKLQHFSSLIVIWYYLLLQLNISVSMMPVSFYCLTKWKTNIGMPHLTWIMFLLPHQMQICISMCLTKWNTLLICYNKYRKKVVAMPHSIGYYLSMCLTKWKNITPLHPQMENSFRLASPDIKLFLLPHQKQIRIFFCITKWHKNWHASLNIEHIITMPH